jgi:hypothetical protein
LLHWQAYPQLSEALDATNVQAYLDAGQGQDERRQLVSRHTRLRERRS